MRNCGLRNIGFMFRRLVLRLAIMAMAAHSPVTAFATQSADAAAAEAGTVAICTGHGIERVAVDASGQPIGHQPGAHEKCAYCVCCAPIAFSLVMLEIGFEPRPGVPVRRLPIFTSSPRTFSGPAFRARAPPSAC